MLKMYQRRQTAASEADFWDENWEAGELAAVLGNSNVCENDPLYPLFQEKRRPEQLFLEGGCGQAQWVKYFGERGQRTIGFDFAERTVRAVKALCPALDVRVGNILALPLEDGAVHTYYSGGVVEHFERGPEPALAEARRVIARDGWFLCSVPDHSSLRHALFAGDYVVRSGYGVARVDRPAVDEVPGMPFFQYVFTEPEFCAYLEAAGFSVERTFGYSMMWGLMEIPGVTHALDAAVAFMGRLRRRAPGIVPSVDGLAAVLPASAPAVTAERAPTSLLKRALVREDPTLPLLGPLLRSVRERCSNMRMYVARPR